MATRPSKAVLTLDANILVYAELEPETTKGTLARRLIGSLGPSDVMAAQALLEYVAAVRRLRPQSLAGAIVKVEAMTAVCNVAHTSSAVVISSLGLVNRHRFQVWDAVIWSASRSAGATHLLTEDLQDGFTADGMTAVNPFAMNAAALEDLVGPDWRP